MKRRQTGIHSSHIKILVGQGEHLTPPCFNAPCLFLISLNRSRLGIVYFQWPLPAMQRWSVSVPNPSYAQAQGCTFTGGKKGVSSRDQPFSQLGSKSDAKKFHLPSCLYSHLMREEVDNLSYKLANSLLTLQLWKYHERFVCVKSPLLREYAVLQLLLQITRWCWLG